ncbi:hypothetical protein H8S90_06890 [Olivibacter sp. SDN3]|uniref:hypothetical protein n=1 Tax=Olivibacter sp. SDN3 TaxID=2764720 RepID=UPI0016517F55|nr:hypothetical protein [Olivibacter sp. SDN3]QNL51295.1 hypothetical protein H8S90_06890 [Olivibacter sp. SDN3]
MKKKSLLQVFIFLNLFLAGLTSCKKETTLPNSEEDIELQEVTFKFKGFSSVIKPLATTAHANRQAAGMSFSQQQNFSNTLNASETSYLYFWSFNSSNLLPDVAIHRAGSGITLESEDDQASYFPGYGNDQFPAGYCLSTRGTQSLLFAMPLNEVSELSSLALDVGSSNTGPKNFGIYYSVDGGNEFTLISDDNQFTNMNAQARNQFTFDLSELTDALDEPDFLIKIEPFAGDRGSAGEYNDKTGTFRVDNFRLSGVFDGEIIDDKEPLINQIHYYIFNADDHQLATEGISALDEKTEEENQLSIRLPSGTYYAFFVSNTSSKDLLLPAEINQASDLYIANHFDNAQAIIFGATTPTFDMSTNVQLDVILNRHFSNILFEFTDEEDLTEIGEIHISRVHENITYTPFGSPEAQPITDAATIRFSTPFTDGENIISFNQFLGETAVPLELDYEITVLDQHGNLLRTFALQGKAPNNVQLIFKGELLSGTDRTGGFLIDWNHHWDDTITESF